MATIAAADLFNKDAFSDITIAFGGRLVKAHKIILCRSSEYFNSLCGPDSQFPDAEKAVVELKDDDPDALEGLLRYIYTFQWKGDQTHPDDWEYHLKVAITAKKYLIPDLPDRAYSAFIEIIRAADKPSTVLDIIRSLRAYQDQDGRIPLILNQLCDNHMRTITKEPRFRDVIDNDKDFRWRYIEWSIKATDMIETIRVYCDECDSYESILDPGSLPFGNCPDCDGTLNHHKVWMKY